MIGLIAAALLIAAEQLVKYIVEIKHIRRDFAGGRVRIAAAHNYGMLLGVLKNKKVLPLLVQTAVFLLLCVGAVPALIAGRGRRLFRWGCALLIAGAGGNVLDRWIHGYVIDFIRFPKCKRLGKLVFDPADFEITAGAVLAALGALLNKGE